MITFRHIPQGFVPGLSLLTISKNNMYKWVISEMTKFPCDSKLLRIIKAAVSKELQRISRYQETK